MNDPHPSPTDPQQDPLDALLARRPLREAPSWFTVRTMARIREEKARQPWWRRWWVTLPRPTVWVGATLLVIVGIGWMLLPGGAEGSGQAQGSAVVEATAPMERHEERARLFAALDAFESLQEEDLLLWPDTLGSL